jgi:uncharacterized protein (DUF1697 family)
MEELRDVFESLGFKNTLTYVQSGNVLFEADETDEDKLRTQIERQIERTFGSHIPVIIRMIHDLKKIVKNLPYDSIKEEDKGKLYVTFLSEAPSYDVKGALGVYSNDAEYARVIKREVYVYSGNYGKTCFSNSFIEKKLRVSATTRNWATINKILEL